MKLGSVRKSGFGLILVIALAAVLAVFTAAVATRVAMDMRSAARVSQAEQAQYGAQGAIQLALGYLCDPPGDLDVNDDGIHDSWLGSDRVGGIEFKNGIVAAARLYHNISGLPGQIDPSKPNTLPPDGTDIPAGYYYLVAVGEAPSGVRSEAVTLGTLASQDFPMMDNAIFAREELEVNGRVDYFSSAGSPDNDGRWLTYSRRGAPVSDPSGQRPYANIANDSKNPDNTSIGKEAQINGSLLFKMSLEMSELDHWVAAQAGPYHLDLNPDDVLMRVDPLHYDPASPPPKYDREPLAGYVTKQIYQKDFPSFDIPSLSPSVKKLPVSGGKYVVPSEGLKLTEGCTYLCEGDFESNGASGEVIIDDANNDDKLDSVRVIVTGSSLVFSDSKNINKKEAPHLLKFLATNPVAKLTINNSEPHALFAGNDLEIVLTNSSEVWGALFGRKVVLSDANSAVHYEYQLATREDAPRFSNVTLGSITPHVGAILPARQLAIPAALAEGDTPGPVPQKNPPMPPAIVSQPFDPGDPPAQPADPPAQPADPPAQPADPPAQPADPPAQPADPPAQPADPPAQPPLDPPGDPSVPPSGGGGGGGGGSMMAEEPMQAL